MLFLQLNKMSSSRWWSSHFWCASSPWWRCCFSLLRNLPCENATFASRAHPYNKTAKQCTAQSSTRTNSSFERCVPHSVLVSSRLQDHPCKNAMFSGKSPATIQHRQPRNTRRGQQAANGARASKSGGQEDGPGGTGAAHGQWGSVVPSQNC